MAAQWRAVALATLTTSYIRLGGDEATLEREIPTNIGLMTIRFSKIYWRFVKAFHPWKSILLGFKNSSFEAE